MAILLTSTSDSFVDKTGKIRHPDMSALLKINITNYIGDIRLNNSYDELNLKNSIPAEIYIGENKWSSLMNHNYSDIITNIREKRKIARDLNGDTKREFSENSSLSITDSVPNKIDIENFIDFLKREKSEYGYKKDILANIYSEIYSGYSETLYQLPLYNTTDAGSENILSVLWNEKEKCYVLVNSSSSGKTDIPLYIKRTSDNDKELTKDVEIYIYIRGVPIKMKKVRITALSEVFLFPTYLINRNTATIHSIDKLVLKGTLGNSSFIRSDNYTYTNEDVKNKIMSLNLVNHNNRNYGSKQISS